MNTFDDQLKTFFVKGEYTNNLDDSGNVNIFVVPTDFTQIYIGIDLINYVYDKEKIESLYDVNIREFSIPDVEVNKPSASDSVNNVDLLTIENTSLKEQLSAIIDFNNNNSTLADSIAYKNIIIDLRIQLGQGKSESDFSDVFPYLTK